MMQARGVESLVDQHRQELIGQAGPVRAGRHVPSVDQDSAAQRSAAGFPVPGGRAVGRAVAPRFGSWLIAFGTRLGGATIRTSS
jgi:hypothetical protein